VSTVPARPAAAGGPDRTVLNASGYVTARRAATVSSKVTGKVMELLIEEGMKVQAGQVLARLDASNVEKSLPTLVKNKIATQADYDHAEATALAYKAQLLRQEADVVVADRTVATWQQQMDDTVIRAPFAGIVTSKNAQPGEMISPVSAGGGFTRTGICTIVDMQSLEIEIDVNESYINRVEPAQPVEATLDAYSDWKIPCKVIAIIPTADRQKSTVKVRVGFDKLDPRILPEMSIKVAFRETAGPGPAAAIRAVLIPKAALQQLDGKDVVFVVLNDRAERRAVTVSGNEGEDAILSAGIAAGERVIVDSPKGLANGSAVKERTGRK
jgi:RND family efflux transporter MFP subunit